MRFEVQSKQLFRYLWANALLSVTTIYALFIILPGIILFEEGASGRTITIVSGVIIGAGLIHLVLWRWHSKAFSNTLSYELKDGILHISQGVFTYQQQAIPLDRVTDIRLVQGALMRRFGLWNVYIQTAGAGVTGPEGTILAAADPIALRETLLKARDKAVGLSG
ncbi:MAG: PH domain-containing protein [Chloroflexota bacterium]